MSVSFLYAEMIAFLWICESERTRFLFLISYLDTESILATDWEKV